MSFKCFMTGLLLKHPVFQFRISGYCLEMMQGGMDESSLGGNLLPALQSTAGKSGCEQLSVCRNPVTVAQSEKLNTFLHKRGDFRSGVRSHTLGGLNSRP